MKSNYIDNNVEKTFCACFCFCVEGNSMQFEENIKFAGDEKGGNKLT